MRKGTIIKISVAVVGVVFAFVAFERGSSLYSDFRYQQRERHLEQLQRYFEAYRRDNGGYLPPDLQALAASQPLESELRKLIDSGRVSYTAPTDYSWGYDWQLSIDGQGYFMSATP